MAKKKSEWIKPIFTGVVSGLIVLAIGWTVPYNMGQASVASMLRDGVSILDAQSTSDSLGDIATKCRKVTLSLEERKPRPAEAIIVELRDAFTSLGASIGRVKTTEYYTASEIKELANTMSYVSNRDAFIRSHVGKPKRTISGLSQLKPHLATIDELLESLDRQLAQEPSIDLDSLRNSTSEIQRLASAAQASLESRQAAALQTLERFETEREQGSAP